jgi:hypothetical protein
MHEVYSDYKLYKQLLNDLHYKRKGHVQIEIEFSTQVIRVITYKIIFHILDHLYINNVIQFFVGCKKSDSSSIPLLAPDIPVTLFLASHTKQLHKD